MLLALLLLACNPEPSEADYASLGQVGYRDPLDEGASSGERGTVKISEVLWSGSVNDDGQWARGDVFVELRNEGNRPVNLSGWYLVLEGATQKTWRIPASDLQIEVGAHAFIATRTDRCFPDPDWVIPDLVLPYGDSLSLVLLDADERLIEPIGSREGLPFAGGFDGVDSRSMERIQLMFGGYGTSPQVWHFYTDVRTDVPNNDRVAANCRIHTLASPGRANSPDYSGAYASGSFD